MPTSFFIGKTLSRVWDQSDIINDCVWWNMVFASDNTSVATVSINGAWWAVNSVWIWTAHITETTWFCDIQTPITLTVTDDGLSPIVNKDEYMQGAVLEIIIFWVIVAIATVLRLKHWLP